MEEKISQEDDMSAQSRRRFLLSLMIPFTVSACGAGPESEKIAKQFMDAYYVKIDLEAAKKVSSGLAAEKLEKQLVLIQGLPPDQGKDLPKVNFHLSSTGDATSTEASYIFEVDPHVQDVGKRKVFVKLRQEGGEWKVSQFSEQP
ncbi:MAG TPA: hypothetical protein DF383_03455 [Deltaproteobacteria bacterium]|nr:hypothetical protein [Deltaproteobacteria bacterium]